MSIYIHLTFTTPLLSYQNKKGYIISFREFSYYIGVVYQNYTYSISSNEGEIGTKTHPHLYHSTSHFLETHPICLVTNQ